MATLTRPEAATIALDRLGGARAKVGTEDVADEAGRLAPRLFSWVKFPDRIDKELVRRALTDAKLKKKWTIGTHLQGWMLTPKGLSFAKQNKERVRSEAERGRQTRDPGIDKERGRLIASDAYVHARRAGVEAVTTEEADAFFRLIAYIRGQARQRKIAGIVNAFSDDPELGPVVIALAARAEARDRDS